MYLNNSKVAFDFFFKEGRLF